MPNKSQLFAGRLVAFVFVCGVCAEAHAGAIAISNHDIELPAQADGGINTGSITSWTETGNGTNGNFNPNGNSWYLTLDDEDDGGSGGVFGTMDGPVVGFFYDSSTGAFTQTTAHALVVGETYTLNVAIGQRDASGGPAFAGYKIDLLSGASVLASVTGTSGPSGAGTFGDATLVHTATVGDPAGLIGVRVGVLNSGYLDFDNVRLTYVPEPATLAFAAVGGLAMIRRRRKYVRKP